MRTFRLIGMALLAVVMCVNFTSCSSDDDPIPTHEEELVKNEFGVIINEKKLLSMKIDKGYGHVTTYDFRYNSKGCITSININGNDFNFTWGDNTVTEERYEDKITYILLDNLIRVKEEEGSITLRNDISYNSSNQITKLEIKHNNNKLEERNYTWDKDKLIKVTSPQYDDIIYITEYRYSGKTCKGYFPHLDDLYDYNNLGRLHYAHPELIGIRRTQLPDQIYVKDSYEDLFDYTYTFDKDGYVETCTEIRTFEGEYHSTTTYTFKWV